LDEGSISQQSARKLSTRGLLALFGLPDETPDENSLKKVDALNATKRDFVNSGWAF